MKATPASDLHRVLPDSYAGSSVEIVERVAGGLVVRCGRKTFKVPARCVVFDEVSASSGEHVSQPGNTPAPDRCPTCGQVIA